VYEFPSFRTAHSTRMGLLQIHRRPKILGGSDGGSIRPSLQNAMQEVRGNWSIYAYATRQAVLGVRKVQVSPHKVSHLSARLLRKEEFSTCPEDRPLFAQFCANDPEVFLSAARLIQNDVDAVDLNLGCPQRIAKRGR